MREWSSTACLQGADSSDVVHHRSILLGLIGICLNWFQHVDQHPPVAQRAITVGLQHWRHIGVWHWHHMTNCHLFRVGWGQPQKLVSIRQGVPCGSDSRERGNCHIDYSIHNGVINHDERWGLSIICHISN